MPWIESLFVFPFLVYSVVPRKINDGALTKLGDFVDWALGRGLEEIPKGPWEEDSFFDQPTTATKRYSTATVSLTQSAWRP